MKVVSGIINIAIGLFIGLFAQTGLNQYFYANEEDVLKYESLQNEGIIAVATLDSTYNETTITIKGIESKIYDIDYEFEVDENYHKGRYFFDHPDSIYSKTVSIRYLKSDPSINAANVERQLKEARKELESDSDLWFGLAAAAISTLLLILGIRKIIAGVRALNTPKKP